MFRISYCICLYLPLTTINKLRCPDAVNFITLPPELSKSLVNEKKWVHSVNILNSSHIFGNNSFKYLLLMYKYSFLQTHEHKYHYLHTDVVINWLKSNINQINFICIKIIKEFGAYVHCVLDNSISPRDY